METSSTEENYEEVWKKARSYAAAIGAPSAMFTSCIRAISSAEMALAGKDDKALQDLAINSVLFLVNLSPSLKAVFYEAAKVMYPKRLGEIQKLSVRSLLGLFQPSEISSIVGITYLYRRVKKRCPDVEWNKFSERLRIHMTVGAIIGETISHVGAGYGMLIGAFRVSAFGLFACKDAKGFQEYWRKLKIANKFFDSELEYARFGCSSLDVASVLAQNLGYGTQAGMGLGYAQLSLKNELLPPELEEKILCWKNAIVWIEAFHSTGEPPLVTDPEDAMFMEQDELNQLKEKVISIIDNEAGFRWISATIEDLPQQIQSDLEIRTSSSKSKKVEAVDELVENEGSAAEEQ